MSYFKAGTLVALAAILLCSGRQGSAQTGQQHDDFLQRVEKGSSESLQRFSEVKCAEAVHQEKLSPDGKVERASDSRFDYLAIFTDSGGELMLNESRLAIGEAKPDKQHTPLLLTNGFAALFLVFHPYYAGSFRFEKIGEETEQGHTLMKVAFHPVRGSRSPAVLALRGREYPLELTGSAWIDVETGAVTRIVADVGNSLEDVGVKSLRSEVDYDAVAFRDPPASHWFPKRAVVEVETPRQHWRNTHVFTNYQRFSVSTDEKVITK